MRSAISSALTQQTTAATQALAIPSFNVATSIAKSVNDLSIAVSNAYTLTCTNQLNNSQKFTCTNSKDVKIGVIKLNQNNQTLEDCTQKAQAVIDAQSNLATALGQTTAAKQIDNFTTVVVIIFLILGVFAFGFMQFSKSETAKWIVIIILVVVIVLMAAYAYNAFENRLWPFQKKQ
jgi:Mg2+ and Co2+ transporter CorA